MTAWRDVTIPMHPGMTVWPGDPPFSLQADGRIAQGDSCNTSIVTMPTHCGTHCDAPWHFEDGGKRLHEIDPEVYFGTARLIAVTGVAEVGAADLGPKPLPPRILLQTDNSPRGLEGPFYSDYVALAADAAQRLVDEGVRLVGIDYYSIAPYKQPGQPSHHILLQNDVFVVEGLCLAGLSPGDYEFVCLPMPLHGADGAPCRAFLRPR